MDIGTPSRFACLKIEDEDYAAHQGSRSKETKNKKQEKVSKKPKEVKVKTAPAPKLVIIIIFICLTLSDLFMKQGVKKDKKKRQSGQQWEEWKQKDSELVNGHFEDDLQSAILLSKLDFEEKKNLYKQQKDEAIREANLTQNKKKKNKAMSLDQFLHSGDKSSVNGGIFSCLCKTILVLCKNKYMIY